MLDVGDKEKGSPEESESVLQLWIRLMDDQQHYRCDGTTPHMPMDSMRGWLFRKLPGFPGDRVGVALRGVPALGKRLWAGMRRASAGALKGPLTSGPRHNLSGRRRGRHNFPAQWNYGKLPRRRQRMRSPP